MMLIELKPYGTKPLYEQLMLEIKRGIATCQLTPGSPLPSVRSLASDIGINMHTVNKVYKALQAEGVLLKVKSGFVVNPNPLTPTQLTEEKLSNLIYEIALEMKLYNWSNEHVMSKLDEIKFEREDN